MKKDYIVGLREEEADELMDGHWVGELVRCKDCKNADYGIDEDGNRFMKCIGSVKCYGGTTPDFFCADGVKR